MKNILLGFKMTMAVIYTAIGVYIISNPNALKDILNSTMTILFGGLLVAWGLFRGYRAWFIERHM